MKLWCTIRTNHLHYLSLIIIIFSNHLFRSLSPVKGSFFLQIETFMSKFAFILCYILERKIAVRESMKFLIFGLIALLVCETIFTANATITGYDEHFQKRSLEHIRLVGINLFQISFFVKTHFWKVEI